MNKFLHFNIQLPSQATLKQRKRFQSRTAAVAPVSSETVLDLAAAMLSEKSGIPVATTLNIGVTFLSLKDRYCKKDGRDQATQRMAPVTLGVTHVDITPTHIVAELHPYKGILISLRLNKATNSVVILGHLHVGG